MPSDSCGTYVKSLTHYNTGLYRQQAEILIVLLTGNSGNSSGEEARRTGNRSHTKRSCEIKPGPLSGTWCYLSLEPSATLSFHQENSAIAEGLVPLRVPGLDFTELVVLCFCCRSSRLLYRCDAKSAPHGTLPADKTFVLCCICQTGNHPDMTRLTRHPGWPHSLPRRYVP